MILRLLKFSMAVSLLAVFIACSDSDDPVAAPTGSLNDVTVEAGATVTLSGTVSDDVGLSNLSLTSTQLGLNSTVDLDGETSFDLSGITLNIDAATTPASYEVTVSATNTSNVSATFTFNITVTEASCPVDSFEGATSSAASDFSDANDDYYFEDYSGAFTGIALDVNDECSTITITGDFLDWGTVDDTFTPTLTLTLTPDASDDSMGTLSFTEEEMGAMSDGFTYRMSSTGSDGTYNTTDGTLSFTVFIDYDIDGTWVNWFTASVTLTLDQ